MATCKDCIHFKICNDYKHLVGRETKVACPDYKSTEDVVPRSEVEEQIAKLLVSETTELHMPMKIAFTVRTEHPIYKAIEQKVAREIFEEIEKPLNEFLSGEGFDWQFADKVAELKKKYIGE